MNADNITAYMQIGGKIHTFVGGHIRRQLDGSYRWFCRGSIAPYYVLDFDGTHALVIA